MAKEGTGSGTPVSGAPPPGVPQLVAPGAQGPTEFCTRRPIEAEGSLQTALPSALFLGCSCHLLASKLCDMFPKLPKCTCEAFLMPGSPRHRSKSCPVPRKAKSSGEMLWPGSFAAGPGGGVLLHGYLDLPTHQFPIYLGVPATPFSSLRWLFILPALRGIVLSPLSFAN